MAARPPLTCVAFCGCVRWSHAMSTAYATEAARPAPRMTGSFTRESAAARVGGAAGGETADVRLPQVGVEVVAGGTRKRRVRRDHARDRPDAALLYQNRSAGVPLTDRTRTAGERRLQRERADRSDRRRPRAQRREVPVQIFSPASQDRRLAYARVAAQEQRYRRPSNVFGHQQHADIVLGDVAVAPRRMRRKRRRVLL